MELDSRHTGTPLRDFTTRVNWRDTMNYAASINDTSSFYFDDEREGGIIAPPMYAVALTWKILGRIHEFIDTDDFPMEVIARQVHYTEYLEFHRPLRPDDQLTIKGHIAAILPHRAGTHVVIRFDALDIKGEPVFTEFQGGLMRGVTCTGGGAGKDALPVIPEHSAKETEWEVPVQISPMQPFVYDGCTDIFFPIHTSKKFARQVGLPDIILQGTATLALAVRETINREAAGDPARLKRLYCRFTGMVLPGTEIQVRRMKTSPNKNIFFDVLNAKGETALSRGFAEITGT